MFNFSNINDLFNRPLGERYSVQRVVSRFLRGQKLQLRGKKYKQEILNIGCGPNIFPQFVNIDYLWRPKIDVCWDITKGLPFQNSSFSGIFTEHCLEHISYNYFVIVLKEMFRILVPGGRVRIILPDAGLYISLYNRFYAGEKVSIPYVSPEEMENGFKPIRAVNRIFRDHGHLYAYDFFILTELLTEVGFSEIVRTSFMQGSDQRLLVDSEERRLESLYVEAVKPD